MRFFKCFTLCSLVMLWLAACAQSSQPALHEHQHDQASATVAKAGPTAITIDELRKQMDQGTAIIFIDTRNEMAWETSSSQIPGAIRISNNDQLAAMIKQLPKESFIVPYCTWPDEASSASLARALIKVGYKQVYPLKGGLAAWEKAGLPLVNK